MSSSPPGTEEDTAGGGMVDGEAPRAHAGGGGGGGAGENHTASGSDGEEDEMDGGGGDSDGRDYSDDDGDDSDGSDSDEEEGRGEEGGGGGRVSERKAAEAEAEEKPRAVATCCICMEPWASDGAHRICCIPCGHVYGRSCLERWLFRCGGSDGDDSARCPQCGNTFKHKHIINLYSTVHLWNDCYHKERDEEMMGRIRQSCEQLSRHYALHFEKKLKAKFELLHGHMERTLANNQSMSQMEIMNFMMQNWPELGL